MSLVNNIIRKARPSLFSGSEPCLCDWCDDTAQIKDSVGFKWPCPNCHLGVLNSLKDKSAPLYNPEHFRGTAKAVWEALGDVPVTDDMELDTPFFHFDAGTDAHEVWHWIESTFEVSVTELG